MAEWKPGRPAACLGRLITAAGLPADRSHGTGVDGSRQHTDLHGGARRSAETAAVPRAWPPGASIRMVPKPAAIPRLHSELSGGPPAEPDAGKHRPVHGRRYGTDAWRAAREADGGSHHARLLPHAGCGAGAGTELSGGGAEGFSARRDSRTPDVACAVPGGPSDYRQNGAAESRDMDDRGGDAGGL